VERRFVEETKMERQSVYRCTCFFVTLATICLDFPSNIICST
jgi:hypothetical protein